MYEQSAVTEWYRDYRSYMISVAYRMLGSFQEAEDVVQEVFAKLHHIPQESIRQPKPFLTKLTVRRALDVLKSARRRREQYIGPWLPEPDVKPFDGDIEHRLIIEETIGYALLAVMEQLTPSERAVFLMHEVLGYNYDEVASALGKTEPACRKLMSRARGKLSRELPATPASPSRMLELTASFLQAAQGGDAKQLLRWLSEDAICLTDGGGAVKAAVKPLEGAERVAAFLAGIASKAAGASFVPLLVNGALGLGVIEQGAWSSVIVADWREDQVRRIYIIRNPAKLAHMKMSLSYNEDEISS